VPERWRAEAVKVQEIMVAPVVVVREDASLEEVARTMLEHKIGCVAVVDDRGELTGIITESDFTGREHGFPFSAYRAPKVFGKWFGKDDVQRIHQGARTRRAREIMTSPVRTAHEDETVTDVVTRMIELDLKRVPVVRDKRPVGIVTRHDLLKLMVASADKQS
jgi:CBS domain-containing protein